MEDHDVSSDIKKLVNAAKKNLLNKTFCGLYQDRRLIPVIDSYRDAIYVDRKEMVISEDFANIVDAASRYKNIKFLSLIKENKDTVIFTKLEKGVPLGPGLWSIVDIVFDNNELIFQIKFCGSYVATHKDDGLNFSNILEEATSTMRELITLNNIRSCSQYLFILVITLFNVFIECLRLFMVIYLGTLHNLPKIIDSVTPFFLAVVNGVTKCVGGLYILIAMLFRGGGPRQDQRHGLPPGLTYSDYDSGQYHPIQYDVGYKDRTNQRQSYSARRY